MEEQNPNNNATGAIQTQTTPETINILNNQTNTRDLILHTQATEPPLIFLRNYRNYKDAFMDGMSSLSLQFFSPIIFFS